MEPRKAILMLMFATAQADGNIDNDELLVAWNNNLLHLGYDSLEASKILDEYLNGVGALPRNSIISNLTGLIPDNMKYGTFEMMCQVADADTVMDEGENQFLKTVSEIFNISEMQYLTIRLVANSKSVIALTTKTYYSG